MWGEAGRHAELAGELVEWWEDLWQRAMSSRVVLVAVPPGWGRSVVLDRLAETVDREDAPVTLVARVNGRELPDGTGLQAAALRECLAEAGTRHRVAELLGMDRLGGAAQMGIGVSSLFVSGLAAAVGFLAAGVAVGAVGKAWDDSPAGQDGALARTARAVAETSVQVPTIVIIDDADCLEENAALTLIENLIARHNGHVLVVAAVDPGSGLKKALRSRARLGITEGLVHVADADPDMGYQSRFSLAREMCPRLPAVALGRIARSTATFADVFTITAAPRLAEIRVGEADKQMLEAVDAVISARMLRREPSPEAVIVAWAGGLLHTRQAARALGIRGAQQASADRDVLQWQSLERLTDPASPRLAVQVKALPFSEKQAMAAALLDEALIIAADAGSGRIDRMAASQAASRVRADLADRNRLPRVQRELAAQLEALGEPVAALEVATMALNEWPPGGTADDRDWLAAAVLRLARISPPPRQPPLVTALIAEAVAGGATLGMEARIWAAVDLLHIDDQREAALNLIDQVCTALDHHADLGTAGTSWRLLLAFHVGRVGHPRIAERLLTPLLNSGDARQEDAAWAVLHTAMEPGADTRLQNVVLEAELDALPPQAEGERLRVHHALAHNHAALGEYRQALTHSQHELDLLHSIQYPDHPDGLIVRSNIANWTGLSGDPAESLRLFRGLLPDMERVLGRDHFETLRTRSNIANWTGRCGDPAESLRLFRGLLPDTERVLGRSHPSTLVTRGNMASWTDKCGDPAGALRLFRGLLPDMERVLGRSHPNTLTIRNNVAHWTGECGDAARALRLFRDLLPDQERVLGPGHFETLRTRGSIATWTGKCGDLAESLRLFRSLLPDTERVLGRSHPSTLEIRNNLAYSIGRCGDPAESLRLFRSLLPDMERVLGRSHPSTLTTRNSIAYLSREK